MPDPRKLFETLVREHTEMLTIYLTSALGDVPEVDDLFQETMVVAWQRLDDYDHTRPFGPWLRGIARNLLLAHRRQEARTRCTPAVLDQLEARLAQLGERPGDTWREKLSCLRTCVGALPEHYHTVVSQRYFHCRTIEQMSAALGVTVAAVKKRLQRARALVLDCMERKLASVEV
ncbi:MAG: RNA polymerase sigma factor [Planctomycetota bacterium]